MATSPEHDCPAVKPTGASKLIGATWGGINKFIATNDAAVPACMMTVNDKGLAGSVTCGKITDAAQPRFRGIMNTHVLRHIAEQAEDCDAGAESTAFQTKPSRNTAAPNSRCRRRAA